MRQKSMWRMAASRCVSALCRVSALTLVMVILCSLCGCDFQYFINNLPSAEDLPLIGVMPTAEEVQQSLPHGTSALAVPSIRTESTLIVGVRTSDASGPFLIQRTDGTIAGYDVDLAAALADELGLSIRFVAVENVDSSLEDTVDIVMGVSSDEVKDSAVVDTYSESAIAFFRRGEEGVVSVSDLSDSTVCLQTGSLSEEVLDSTTLDMNRVLYDAQQSGESLKDAFTNLASGSFDYVLCSAYVGGYYTRTNEQVNFAGTLDEPTSRGIAVSSSNETLKKAVSQAMATMQANGVYDVIRARWVGDLPVLTADLQIKDVPLVVSETDTYETEQEGEEDGTLESTYDDTQDVTDSDDDLVAGTNAITAVP